MRYDRSLPKRCPRCTWLFQCPVDQWGERTYCRPCESGFDATLVRQHADEEREGRLNDNA